MDQTRRSRKIFGRRKEFVGLIALPNSSQALSLDTNIFIQASSPTGPFHLAATNLLSHLTTNPPRIFLSVLILEEFFVKVYKLKHDKDTASIVNFLTINGQATLVDVNRDIALRAAKIRADHPSVRAPDALHIATALYSNSQLLITTDRRLPRKIENLTIVSPT